ncbi:hypothetical protein B0H21DRAFT_347621 [Amylocystis lapponica]|nr:hypothetical protein B0H21DRAFT_347621 [Amylocystis lapponica]
MRRTGPPRLNRFPQRLDYTLIPAPLDLSRPLVDEKASLPAIIVTPSSPSHDGDFSIAFLVPPPKPSFVQRLAHAVPSIPPLQSYLPSQIQLPQSAIKTEFERGSSSSSWSLKTRARATILLMLLLFIMGCHVIMHGFINARPHLDFGMLSDNDIGTIGKPGSSDLFGSLTDARHVEEMTPPPVGGWFNFNALWAPIGPTDAKRTPEFVVWDSKSSEGRAV